MVDIIEYISPSLLPSRSANSIHVINQCNALAERVDKVILYCAIKDRNLNHEKIYGYYGINLRRNVILRGFVINSYLAMQLKLALYAFLKIVGQNRVGRTVISRNLYGSFLLTLVRWRHVYETHGLESSYIKKRLQNIIMLKNNTVAISQKLAVLLKQQCMGANNIIVLHDAASEPETVDVSKYLVGSENYKIGYFGHLYPGRGIEIIQALANQIKNIDFYVVGGDEESIALLRSKNRLSNFKIIGFVKNMEARTLMSQVDLLLMPYQNKVSIGLKKSDTSKWMSPLKMFEYMCANRPIISSDLPVLKEVLNDGENCLLVDPQNVPQWKSAVLELYHDRDKSSQIANFARQDFLKKYTWEARAKSLIEHDS
jgi:glycosyltransferase involved in cell wall biosynthesis